MPVRARCPGQPRPGRLGCLGARKSLLAGRPGLSSPARARRAWASRLPCSAGGGALPAPAAALFTSSPSAAMTAINWLTGTSVAPSGTTILAMRALVHRFVFHRRLVGLDLGDDVTRLDLVALFLEPLGEVALFHRGRQRRHQDVDGHIACDVPPFRSTGSRPLSPPRRLRRPTATRAFPDWRHRASAHPCR